MPHPESEVQPPSRRSIHQPHAPHTNTRTQKNGAASSPDCPVRVSILRVIRHPLRLA